MNSPGGRLVCMGQIRTKVSSKVGPLQESSRTQFCDSNGANKKNRQNNTENVFGSLESMACQPVKILLENRVPIPMLMKVKQELDRIEWLDVIKEVLMPLHGVNGARD